MKDCVKDYCLFCDNCVVWKQFKKKNYVLFGLYYVGELMERVVVDIFGFLLLI